jgi:glutaredoxin-like YruB-family protein
MAKITIYSTPTCGYCKMAKQYFEENNIEYEEHDVAADEAKRAEMVEKSGQLGVPVIDINGEIQVGFNKPEIERAIQEAKQ